MSSLVSGEGRYLLNVWNPDLAIGRSTFIFGGFYKRYITNLYFFSFINLLWILSDHWWEVKRGASWLYWVVFLWKHSVDEGGVPHVGSYTVWPWFSSFSLVYYWALFSQCLSIIRLNMAFLDFNTSFLSWAFSWWYWGNSFCALTIKRWLFCQELLSFSLGVFHSASHNNHLELLLHYKIILLNKVFLLLFAHSPCLEILDSLHFALQCLCSFGFF